MGTFSDRPKDDPSADEESAIVRDRYGSRYCPEAPKLDDIESLPMIVGNVDRSATEVNSVSWGPPLLRVLPITVTRDVASLRETWIVDDPTTCGVSVLRSPQGEVGLVVKSETALLVLPWEKGVVLFGSILVARVGVVVAASVLRTVCSELGSWDRLTIGLDVPLDIPFDIPLDIPLDVSLVTKREPIS